MSCGPLTAPSLKVLNELQRLKPAAMEPAEITKPRATKAKGVSIESLFAENLKLFIASNNSQKQLFKHLSDVETSSSAVTSDCSSNSRSDNRFDVSLTSFDDCDCQDMHKLDELKHEPKECFDIWAPTSCKENTSVSIFEHSSRLTYAEKLAMVLAVVAKTKTSPAVVACADDFAPGSSKCFTINEEEITASLTPEPIAVPDTTMEFPKATKIADASKVPTPGPSNALSERKLSKDTSARSRTPLEHLQSKAFGVQSSKNAKVEPQVHVIRKLNLPRNIYMPQDPRFKGYCHRWLDRPDFCTKEMCIFKHANPPELVKEYGFVIIRIGNNDKTVRDAEPGSTNKGCRERSLSPRSLPQACEKWIEFGERRFMEKFNRTCSPSQSISQQNKDLERRNGRQLSPDLNSRTNKKYSHYYTFSEGLSPEQNVKPYPGGNNGRRLSTDLNKRTSTQDPQRPSLSKRLSSDHNSKEHLGGTNFIEVNKNNTQDTQRLTPAKRQVPQKYEKEIMAARRLRALKRSQGAEINAQHSQRAQEINAAIAQELNEIKKSGGSLEHLTWADEYLQNDYATSATA